MGEEKVYLDILKQVGEQSVQYAKMYAPVDTGMMEEDIYGYLVGEEFILTCGIDWAVYNEYGTIKMPVGSPDSPLGIISTSGKYAFRPFMRPATIRASDEAPEIFDKKIIEIWS